MEIVGYSVTETDIAMELCKEVQMEEYAIHVVGSTNFYTRLQFSLLASTWFPRPLGVCLWSALHVFLVLYKALMLLVLYSTLFVLAVLADAPIVALLGAVSLFALSAWAVVVIVLFGIYGIYDAARWLWLRITCQCCTLGGRAPGQGDLGPQDRHPAAVVELGEAEAAGGLYAAEKRRFDFATVLVVQCVIQVSFPYRRAQLGGLCREIVPRYDTVVI